jgi:hypothetical protein
MSEADSAAEWVRVMTDRYRWGDDVAEAEAMSVEEWQSVQFMLEWMFFEGKLNFLYRK